MSMAPPRSLIFWPLKAEGWFALVGKLPEIKSSWPTKPKKSRGLLNHPFVHVGNDVYVYINLNIYIVISNKISVAPLKWHSNSSGTLSRCPSCDGRQALEYAMRCSMKPGLRTWNDNGSLMQLNVSDLGEALWRCVKRFVWRVEEGWICLRKVASLDFTQ